jgi:hypothetical protein
MVVTITQQPIYKTAKAASHDRRTLSDIAKGENMETINQWTGKPQPHNGLPRRSDKEYCENGHDDTELIYDCVFCGAPVCCPKCCSEDRNDPTTADIQND